MACIQPSSGWGSSPRVRGTPERSRWRQRRHGIIPACAGNTIVGDGTYKPFEDHPRVCGEHSQSTRPRTEPPGSSPRVRGTPRPRGRIRRERGIIPACAGNTIVGDGTYKPFEDHPRVCGEHSQSTRPRTEPPGSSPRVRGTPRPRGRIRRERGIIPACAGNTVLEGARYALRRDHPRVCGEHETHPVTVAMTLGSSPRVRGTRRNKDGAANRHGIIPACAGNTLPTRA